MSSFINFQRDYPNFDSIFSRENSVSLGDGSGLARPSNESNVLEGSVPYHCVYLEGKKK